MRMNSPFEEESITLSRFFSHHAQFLIGLKKVYHSKTVNYSFEVLFSILMCSRAIKILFYYQSNLAFFCKKFSSLKFGN